MRALLASFVFVGLATAASFLPAETRVHARASAREGLAAVRSLADGASDLTERAIDRFTLLFTKSDR